MGLILIVEDEPLLRRRLVSVLSAAGHRTMEAENGREAIARLQQSGQAELIILDMVMPHSNGWAFLDFQRAHPLHAEIPILVLSAYEGIALSAHPDGYLSKPVEVATLLDEVNRLLRAR